MKDYKQLNIYFDIKSSNIIIISTGRNAVYGGTSEIDRIQEVGYPYDAEQLYQKITNSLNNCYSLESYINDKPTPIENYLKIKGYGKAVKGKKLLILSWSLDTGYIIVPTEKIKKRGYVHIQDKMIKLGQELEKNNLLHSIIQATRASSILSE
jgi:hypothetical protein